jgi:hypothetical protein
MARAEMDQNSGGTWTKKKKKKKKKQPKRANLDCNCIKKPSADPGPGDVRPAQLRPLILSHRVYVCTLSGNKIM